MDLYVYLYLHDQPKHTQISLATNPATRLIEGLIKVKRRGNLWDLKMELTFLAQPLSFACQKN